MASAIYIDCLSFLSTEDALSLSAKYKIVDRLSFDPDVTVAVIRPPQVYCPDFLSFFPNLTTILSDTTGVSHLSEAFLNPNLKIFTLRDLKSSDRDDLTAASELALLLISLSLRPVIKCHQQLLSSIPSQSDCSSIFSERSSYSGLTWQDVRLGFIGAGRIANSVASSIPSYVGSLSFYDPFINPSDSFCCVLRVDSLDELF